MCHTKLIRNSVFETNSSSCHSISLSKGDPVWDTIYPNQDGEIIIEEGEYGWGVESYNDPLNKARYVWTDGQYKDWLIRAIEEMTGITPTLVNNQGYIDHESVGMLKFDTYEEFYFWLFDKNSWLNITHDNRDNVTIHHHSTYHQDGSVTLYPYEKVYEPMGIQYNTVRELVSILDERYDIHCYEVDDNTIEFGDGTRVTL